MLYNLHFWSLTRRILQAIMIQTAKTFSGYCTILTLIACRDWSPLPFIISDPVVLEYRWVTILSESKCVY